MKNHEKARFFTIFLGYAWLTRDKRSAGLTMGSVALTIRSVLLTIRSVALTDQIVKETDLIVKSTDPIVKAAELLSTKHNQEKS